MAKVSWCDEGNHAFKADEPGSAHMEGSQRNEEGFEQIVTRDICAAHNPYAPANVREQAERRMLTSQAETELLNRGE
jgi:hypothetical protein